MSSVLAPCSKNDADCHCCHSTHQAQSHQPVLHHPVINLGLQGPSLTKLWVILHACNTEIEEQHETDGMRHSTAHNRGSNNKRRSTTRHGTTPSELAFQKASQLLLSSSRSLFTHIEHTPCMCAKQLHAHLPTQQPGNNLSTLQHTPAAAMPASCEHPGTGLTCTAQLQGQERTHSTKQHKHKLVNCKCNVVRLRVLYVA